MPARQACTPDSVDQFLDAPGQSKVAVIIEDTGVFGAKPSIHESGGRRLRVVTEIDDVVLEHPVVAEAAAFGVPDAKYGEEVWAAVVLKGDADAERLQAFCRTRLADSKGLR
jgi:non-ribosomal peptide synthetase component E (peptide arylation enzyme)